MINKLITNVHNLISKMILYTIKIIQTKNQIIKMNFLLILKI